MHIPPALTTRRHVLLPCGLCTHALHCADESTIDAELLNIFRGASSAFSRLRTSRTCEYAERCEITCVLELALRAITARVSLSVPQCAPSWTRSCSAHVPCDEA